MAKFKDAIVRYSEPYTKRLAEIEQQSALERNRQPTDWVADECRVPISSALFVKQARASLEMANRKSEIRYGTELKQI